MIAIPPKGPLLGAVPVVIARDQPQYAQLPALIDPTGLVLTEWEFTAEELAKVLAGGRVRLWVWTFGHGFQPVALEVTGAGALALLQHLHRDTTD